MNKDKRDRLERNGFEMGDAAEFLGLTEAERQDLDGRVGELDMRATDTADDPLPPVGEGRSPLDVPGVDAGLERDEILESLRESRRRLVSDEDQDDRT